MIASSFGAVSAILFLAFGFGLPLGVPPLPEDPLLARLAPAECMAYLSWSGVAAPDAKSPNQVEQLLAEPEVQQFVAAVSGQIDAVVARLEQPPAGRAGAAPPEAAAKQAVLAELLRWGKVFLGRPTAVYLSSLSIGPAGPADVHGGVVVEVGQQAAALQTTLRKLEALLPPGSLETLDIEGHPWQRLRLGPAVPEVAWGVRGKYLLVAVGQGELGDMLKRARGDAPAWRTAIRSQLPVQRPSTVAYVDVRRILGSLPPPVRQVAGMAAEAAGLDNLSGLVAVTGLDQERFVSKILLAINGQPRGLLALLDEKPLGPQDLAAIPADATLALASRLRPDRAMQAILATAEKLRPGSRASVTTMLQQMEQSLGFDLRQDLLAALGDRCCLYNSPGEGGLVLTGLTAVLEVRDAKRLAGVEEKLRAAVAAMTERNAIPGRGKPSIEKLPFAGRDVYFLNNAATGFPFAPAWCLTEKELVVALLPQNIKAYLSRGPEFHSLARQPEVAQVLSEGGGPIWLCYTDTPRLFEMAYPLLPMLAQAAMSNVREPAFQMNVGMLPSTAAIAKHLRPEVTCLRRTAAGIEIVSRRSLPGGGLVPALPLAAVLGLTFGTHRAVATSESVRAEAELEKALQEARPADGPTRKP
jgi:hypothetical protein